MSTSDDLAIVGAGLVGTARAYGLAREGCRVVLFDPNDDDLHASAGNLGLVWVQGKGLGALAYEALNCRFAGEWAQFADELAAQTGVCPAYRQCGGRDLVPARWACLSAGNPPCPAQSAGGLPTRRRAARAGHRRRAKRRGICHRSQ